MRLLAYTMPSRGHLYSLVPILAAARERGHQVSVRTLAADVPAVRELGIRVEAIDPEIERLENMDWRERTPRRAIVSALSTFAARAPIDGADLGRAIDEFDPSVLLVDPLSWGAVTVAEASGRPWAMFAPFLLPVPSRGVPPFGPGLAPLRGPLGRLRDAVVGRVVNGGIDRAVLGRLNALRAEHGVSAVGHWTDLFGRPPLVLALTVEGFDYPRSDWPSNVRLVGPMSWVPPTPAPAWLDDLSDPMVLVTCSTERQDDARLLEVALEALPAAGMSVIGTSAAHDPDGFDPPAGSRVVRFAPHDAVLPRAACVVCHGGMGIIQKSLAAEVPVVVVPFGRDQLETARRAEVAQAGVRLPLRRLSPKRLTAAVRTAIELRPGAQRVSQAYAAAGGPEAAVDALEALAERKPG